MARLKLPHLASRMSEPRGRGSVVEHHLAKVGVAGSNPVVRSSTGCQMAPASSSPTHAQRLDVGWISGVLGTSRLLARSVLETVHAEWELGREAD